MFRKIGLVLGCFALLGVLTATIRNPGVISVAGRLGAIILTCADLTNAAASCATDATNANNLGSGTVAAGRLPALTGDVTSSAGSAATTLTAGNAGNLNSGSLLAARMPALTGDITTSVGAVATSIAANAVTNAKAAQMANSTIKCRTTAGTGNSEDCTATQAAAIIGGVGGTIKSKVSLFTRDISTATGTQAITGVGFTPTTCEFFADVAGGIGGASWGFADSARSGGSINATDGVLTFNQVANAIRYLNNTGTNIYAGDVSSYDADGFTISWTKTGTPTGTFTVWYRCMR